MALSVPEQTQLKALIQREGGLVAFTAQIQALQIARLQADALALLAPAISMTVTDWPKLRTYSSGATNITINSVMTSIIAAYAAGDATQLGPLSVMLHAAVKAHLSL